MSKRVSACILSIILLLSTVVILFQTNRKQGYHCDEIFTYGLSNYEGGFEFQTREEDGTPKWNTKDDLYKYLTASDEVKFDYTSVIENQKADVHPPLYYILFHTASSFIPNTYSKFMGVGLNLPFILGTCILIYLIGNTVFEKKWLSLIAVALYALSPNCINMAIYLRMYAMLTFFATAMLYLHIRLFKKNYIVSKKDCILLSLCVLLGSLTHYYFFIYIAALFIFTLCSIHKETDKNERKKISISYMMPFVVAAVIYILLWPTVFKHLFASGRGGQAFGNAISSSFIENLMATFDIAFISGGRLVSIIFIASLLYIGFSNQNKDKNYLSLMMFTGLVYFLVTVKVAPFIVDRYISPVFPIVMICGVYFVYKFLSKLLPNKIKERKTISAIALVLLLSITLTLDISYVFKTQKASDDGYNYLYLRNEECQQFLDENKGKRCVVVYNEWWQILAGFHEYELFSETAFVQIDDLPQFIKTDNFDNDDEMVIYISDNFNTESVLDDIIENSEYTSHKDILNEHSRHWAYATVLQK